MIFGTQQHIWKQSSRWQTTVIFKIVFGRNAAADFPISVKFCFGEAEQHGNGGHVT